MENFYRLALTYKDLNLEAREDFLKNQPEKIIKEFFEKDKIKSYISIVTCLRIEFYIANENIDEIVEAMQGSERIIQTEKGEKAVKSLFEIICGLDSVIIGEDQILSQIKKTFLKAMECKHTNPLINIIFNNAIALGKKFRNLSKVNCKALSLENIAVKFIEEHFENYKEKKVFLIGIGELSKSILFLLNKKGFENLTITNRTFHKAKEIEMEYDVKTVDFHKIYEEIDENEIIISSTSSPHCIIRKKDLLEKIQTKKKRFFLDLAVPRDIENEIGDLENTELYNLDDLWAVYYENVQLRCEVSDEYNYLINEQIEKVEKWIKHGKIN